MSSGSTHTGVAPSLHPLHQPKPGVRPLQIGIVTPIRSKAKDIGDRFIRMDDGKQNFHHPLLQIMYFFGAICESFYPDRLILSEFLSIFASDNK